MFAGYKGSVSHFVFVLVVACMNCSFAFQPFQLTRLKYDEFDDPTVTCQSKQYCRNREALECRWSGGCCIKCLCNYARSTFDVSTLKCRKNKDFRSGCSWRFDVSVWPDHPIKLVDLSKNGAAKFALKTDTRNDEVKSCRINSINMLLRNGTFYLVPGEVVKVKESPKKISGKEWHVVIEWKKVKTELHGKIFKVRASCDIKRKGQKTFLMKPGCFLFKSSGKVIVSPVLSPSPTTAFSRTKTETSSEKPEQPSVHMSTPQLLPVSSSRVTQTVAVTAEPHLVEPTPVVSSPNTLTTTIGFETETSPDVVSPLLPITLPRSIEVFEVPKKITTEGQVLMPSSTSNIAETSEGYIAPTAEKQSDGGNKTAIISSAVVICVLIIVGIVLLLLWSQRRKNRTSAQKQNNRGFTNRGTTADNNNAMVMNNHHENIYAEADDVVSSKCVCGKDHYTSLDKTIPEAEKSDYQSLHADNTNVYEQILEKKGPASGPYLVTAPGDKHDKCEVSTAPVADAIYTDLDETCGQVLPSRSADKHDEQVYSVLEEENAPGNDANSGRITPAGSGNERDERVYSVLENDNEASTAPIADAIYTDLDETSGQVLPSRPADKHDEQVYSVLEEENAPGNESSPAMPDSEYLTVLHTGTPDYEQPFDVPLPDAK